MTLAMRAVKTGVSSRRQQLQLTENLVHVASEGC